MFPIIIIIISFILDGVLTNFLPFTVNNLSLFTPLLTLVAITIIYPFYRKEEKKYYLIVIITGLVYDLFYTNLLFFNAILFFVLALITKLINKNFEVDYLGYPIYLIIMITIYELLTALVIIIFNLVPMDITRLLYKITHSLLLNIIYGELILFLIKSLPKKYKRISIN